jgi:alpha-mannosidase
MQKLPKIYTDRLDRFLSSVYFSDVNLWALRVRHESDGNYRLKVYHVPPEQDGGKPLVSKILLMDSGFEECRVGISIGPAWSTHWFRLTVTVPEAMAGQRVWLRWKMSGESMLYDLSGNPLCGFSNERCEYMLSDEAIGGKSHAFLIEAACNDLFGNGNGGLINPPDSGRHYKLSALELVVYNETTMSLMADLRIMKEMIKTLTVDSLRGADALSLANSVINSIGRPGCSEEVQDEISKALSLTRKFLGIKNSQSAHTVYALGHCHIDTAWLWDYSETRRKCARSWSSQLEFMTREGFSDFRFVCSQMQQYDWVRQDYPRLFERIKEAVAKGQFVPIGGSWVEMDANMPSGESFIRQFLYGQLFTKEHFGFYSKVFWLPGM